MKVFASAALLAMLPAAVVAQSRLPAEKAAAALGGLDRIQKLGISGCSATVSTVTCSAAVTSRAIRMRL